MDGTGPAAGGSCSSRNCISARTSWCRIRQFDQGAKRGVDAREGISHPWFVDPDARTLEAFELRQGLWALPDTPTNDAPVSLPPFDAVTRRRAGTKRRETDVPATVPRVSHAVLGRNSTKWDITRHWRMLLSLGSESPDDVGLLEYPCCLRVA